jgi:Fe-S-cluster-containing dehydrogenase component
MIWRSKMKKITLVFDKNSCMGCHACEIACKQEHGLGVGPRLVRVIEQSPDFTPIYCHHCLEAPCKEVCPVEAIFRNEHGIILIDSNLCTGCRQCIEACPFTAMQFDDIKNIAVKCDLCVDRLTEKLLPACITVCPTKCIYLERI